MSNIRLLEALTFGRRALLYSVSEYWSIGVLECWKKRKASFNLNWSFHYSITPPLQQTAAMGKEYGSPLREQFKAESFGSGFFIGINFQYKERDSDERRISIVHCQPLPSLILL